MTKQDGQLCFFLTCIYWAGFWYGFQPDHSDVVWILTTITNVSSWAGVSLLLKEIQNDRKEN
jgi:hypothetical protein